MIWNYINSFCPQIFFLSLPFSPCHLFSSLITVIIDSARPSDWTSGRSLEYETPRPNPAFILLWILKICRPEVP